METNTQTSVNAEDWINEMKEIASGDFLKFDDDDEVTLRIISEPRKGVSRFPRSDGSEKVEYTIDVILDGSNKVLKWAVSSRSVLQQIVAIMQKEQMHMITGSRLEVMVRGAGKDRKYFLKLIERGS